MLIFAYSKKCLSKQFNHCAKSQRDENAANGVRECLTLSLYYISAAEAAPMSVKYGWDLRSVCLLKDKE